MRPPIIVFDLDGTLIDTAPDLIDSLNHALAGDGFGAVDHGAGRRPCRHGRPRHDRARLRAQPAPASTRRWSSAITRSSSSTIPPAFPAARAPTPACSRRSHAPPEAGYIFAICTNKPEGMAREPDRAARPDRPVRRDLRRRHVCLSQARPAPPDGNHRAGRRRSAARADGRRFAHRHRHGQGGRHPGRGGRFRLHRPPCARVRAEHRDLAFRRADGRAGRTADRARLEQPGRFDK